MLKKADMKPGAIVEVNPVIKTGLPKSMFGDSSMSGSDDRLEFLSVRKSFMLGE